MSAKKAFLGTNAPYLEDLYAQYLQNKNSIPAHWQNFFAELEPAASVDDEAGDGVQEAAAGKPLSGPQSSIEKQNQVSRMVNAFRTYGHRSAHLNPLMARPDLNDDLKPEAFGFSAQDLESEFATDYLLDSPKASLREIFEAARTTYCRTIGVQCEDIPRAERLWLRKTMENRQNLPGFEPERQKSILKGLMSAEKFEQFLHKKFVGVKRFSLEGGESLIPMLHTMVASASEAGVDEIVMGMAHRGRLNVLTNILEKSMVSTMAEFAGTVEMDNDFSLGDVKYHKGKSYDITTANGHEMHIALLPNPSHLEAVNPVVLGSTYARQQRHQDDDKNKVMPLLIHGDTAFIGQGVVAEMLNLGTVHGYNVGGTVHVVINNQLGYTANPEEGFGTEYCTDIARMLQVPIFHVNGDDPEACAYVMALAMDYRKKFKRDVVIDMVCYRQYGHNEGDDPSFTQPQTYAAIKQHTSAYQAYYQHLTQQGVISEAEAEAMAKDYSDKLQNSFDIAKEEGVVATRDMFEGAWQGFSLEQTQNVKTAVTQEAIKSVSTALLEWPEWFTPHPKIANAMQKRAESLTSDGMDWGTAEMAAYGTLLGEGYGVRLSGQDARRGTFAHRHSVLVDFQNGQTITPLANLATANLQKNGMHFEVYNSILSEFGVMGFEFGYSMTQPDVLTIWEAQFGDFANGAQVIIDQFLSSSETKWDRMAGLVLLLPHGQEGQGPEHSSARLERFLQLCAEDNMTVTNPTTPAQIFHLLRRQMHQQVRRPLVVMSPKSLLRHSDAVSGLQDLTQGGWQQVIDDPVINEKIANKKIENKKKVSRVVLCSGKIYYDLAARQKQLGAEAEHVALVRLEQLYPLPFEDIKSVLAGYPEQAQLVWAQEEAKNQGAWWYLQDTLLPQLNKSCQLVALPAMAAPSVGVAGRHKENQNSLVDAVFEKENL